MYLQPPKLLQYVFPDIIWNIREPDRTLYVTFDDGPNPETTLEILRVLEKYDAKATFFCLGKKALQFPELIETVIKNGHTPGNHGFDHLDGWRTKTGTYVQNMEKACEFISSNLFRPPHGHLSPAQLRAIRKKYQLVMWDVMSYDFKVPNAGICYNIIERHAKKGSVIVFHEINKTLNITLQALESTLHFYKKQGFEFKALSYETA